MKALKFIPTLILTSSLFLFGACRSFEPQQAETPMVPPRPLSLPVSKNWKVIEEAPNLTDERGHVPFQTEQSVQPPGAPPVAPSENRKLETPR